MATAAKVLPLSRRADRSVPSRGRMYDSILETVGMTPLVRINRLTEEAGCFGEVYAKLEYFNPLSSVKDRIGVSMIEAAERNGTLTPDTVVVEATSGNTGLGLAFACATRGYRLILVMPESVTLERKAMLMYLGAEIVLTPVENGVIGSIEYAKKLAAMLPNGWMVDQDHNKANIDAHRQFTAEEIWQDTDGAVDYIVAGVGTSGTLSGIADTIKSRKPSVKVIGVEPAASPVLSQGDEAADRHKIIGIGAFVPDFYRPELVDQVISITNEDAMNTAREMARKEGMPTGISGGASVAAAIQIARNPETRGKIIVAVVASCAERYISTELFEPTRCRIPKSPIPLDSTFESFEGLVSALRERAE